MDNEPKYTAKATTEVLFFNVQVIYLISTQKSYFSAVENEIECRETHTQAASNNSCSKGLAEDLKGGC